MAERGLAKRMARAVEKREPFRLFECFEMLENGVTVHGEPSLSQYQSCVDFVERTHKASGWWLVDLIEYGDSRLDFKDMVDAILDHEAITESTKKQYRYLGKALPHDNRVEGVPFGHHQVVAGMEPEDQQEWLERSRERGWSQGDLRKEIRAAARTKVITGQATLEGKYRIIYADPPWKYGDSAPTVDGSLGKAERHYTGMTIEELCKLPVAAHATPRATLLMWTTVPFLLQNPGPREVLEAWGFEYKSHYVWDKVLGMHGHYSHVIHEVLLVCTRGGDQPDVPTELPNSIIRIRRSNEHSQKPNEFRQLAEKHWTTGPYLELFGRERHAGWSVFGNDARLWAEQAAPIQVAEEDVPF